MNVTQPQRPTCPPGLNAVTTYLTVENPQTAIEFYTKIFGFTLTETRKRKGSDRILFARLSFKGSDIMIGPQAAFGGRTGSASPIVTGTQSPIVFYIYCDNANAMYEKLKDDERIEIVRPIETSFWGDRVFKICCPEGYYWDFATNVSDPNPENAEVSVE